jgi:hypothetical protein
MDADRVASVIKIAIETGLPAELFSGWQGHELALYQDKSGQGATIEIAQRQSSLKAAYQGSKERPSSAGSKTRAFHSRPVRRQARTSDGSRRYRLRTRT